MLNPKLIVQLGEVLTSSLRFCGSPVFSKGHAYNCYDRLGVGASGTGFRVVRIVTCVGNGILKFWILSLVAHPFVLPFVFSRVPSITATGHGTTTPEGLVASHFKICRHDSNTGFYGCYHHFCEYDNHDYYDIL